jgi:hypothetical protein
MCPPPAARSPPIVRYAARAARRKMRLIDIAGILFT